MSSQEPISAPVQETPVQSPEVVGLSGLSLEEMMNHPQNQDIKQLLDRRCEYNKLINLYSLLLSTLAYYVNFDNMSEQHKSVYKDLLKQLKDTHIALDPKMADMLPNF